MINGASKYNICKNIANIIFRMNKIQELDVSLLWINSKNKEL